MKLQCEAFQQKDKPVLLDVSRDAGFEMTTVR